MWLRAASARHQGAPKLYGYLNTVLAQKDDSRVDFTSLPAPPPVGMILAPLYTRLVVSTQTKGGPNSFS